MFKNSTVFILGAGASWHYGYPTGERLVEDVIREASALSRHYSEWRQYGQFLTAHARSKEKLIGASSPMQLNDYAKWECDELVNRLKALNPPVIDYFLGQNPKLQDIGRFSISLVILKAEAEYARLNANKNRLADQQSSPYIEERSKKIDPTKFKDDWCRFVSYHISSGCRSMSDVLKNNVSFITFNYDTSLERRLRDGLAAIEIFQGAEIDEFFNDRFLHVYGSVGSYKDKPIQVRTSIYRSPNMPMSGSDLDELQGFVAMMDETYSRSNKIRTIDPDDKDGDQDVINRARRMIGEASEVYILGYGFDENNNRRIQLDSLRQQTSRPHPNIFFTNYKDNGRINKRAAIEFLRIHKVFDRGTFSFQNCQKSDRDVYTALESDFEFFS